MKFLQKSFILIVCSLLLLLLFLYVKKVEVGLEAKAWQQRDTIEKKYGAKINFSKVDFTFFTNLNISLHDVSFKREDFGFKAESITLRLPLFSLLIDNWVVSSVEIVNPDTKIIRYRNGDTNLSDILLLLGGGAKGRVSVRQVTLNGGSLLIMDDFISKKPTEHKIKISTFSVDLPGMISPIKVKLSGKLKSDEGYSKFDISLHWNRNDITSFWKDFRYGGSIDVKELDVAVLRKYFGGIMPDNDITKILSASLKFSGNSDTGTDFSAQFRVNHKKLILKGKVSGNKVRISKISLQLPNFQLNGSGGIENIWGEDPYIKLELDAPFIDVSQVASLVPIILQDDPMVSSFNKDVLKGQIRLSRFSLEGRYSTLFNLHDFQKINQVEGEIEVKGLMLKIPGLRLPINDINGTVNISKDELSFDGVEAKYGKSILKGVSGEIDDYRSSPKLLSEVTAELDVKEFKSALVKYIASKELDEVFEHISEPYGRLGFDFAVEVDIAKEKIDKFFGVLKLDGIGFKHSLFNLPVRELHGEAQISLDEISVENLTMMTGNTVFKSHGKIANFQSNDYSFDLSFNSSGDVSELADTVFYKFAWLNQIAGSVTSKLNVKGNLEDLTFRQSIDFTNAEYSFKDAIKKASGVVSKAEVFGTLKGRKSLSVDSLKINLGNSEAELSGTLPDIESMDEYDFYLDLGGIKMEDFPDFFLSYKKGESSGTITGSGEFSKLAGDENYSLELETDINHLKLNPLRELGGLFKFFELEGTVSGNLAVKIEKDAVPIINGELDGKDVAVQTELNKKFRNLSGKAVFEGNKIKISNVSGTLGDSSGKVSLEALLGETPVVNLIIDGDVVHLSDIVDIEDPNGRVGDEESPESEIYAKWNVTISGKEGTLEKIRCKNVDSFFSYYKSRYDFSFIKFQAYGGDWETKGSLDTAGEGNQIFDSKVKVSGISLAPFLKDVIPTFQKMNGKMDISGKINGNGLGWDRFSKTLGGKLNYTAKMGRVYDFDGLSQLWTYLNITPLFKERKNEQAGKGLPYDSIKGVFNFNNGVGNTKDTMLEGDIIRISAVGDVDLGKSKLNLTMGVKPFTSIDSLISSIPIAGDILTGKEKSLFVSYYKVGGAFHAPTAEVMPIESIGRGLFGIFKRLFEMPAKVLSIDDKKDSK